jgi:hypothetical protein
MGVSATAADPARSFTFRDAEFSTSAQGAAAAQEFVDAALPVGLPLAQARGRLVRAAMDCGAPRPPSGAVVCDYSELVHIEGGLIGESHWRVRLNVDSSGRLASATLRHFNVGVGDPNP